MSEFNDLLPWLTVFGAGGILTKFAENLFNRRRNKVQTDSMRIDALIDVNDHLRDEIGRLRDEVIELRTKVAALETTIKEHQVDLNRKEAKLQLIGLTVSDESIDDVRGRIQAIIEGN